MNELIAKIHAIRSNACFSLWAKNGPYMGEDESPLDLGDYLLCWNLVNTDPKPSAEEINNANV